MNRLCVLLMAATVLSSARRVDGQNRSEIAMTGVFLGDGPWAQASGQWLLLAERSGAFELREVVATATRIAPVCGDLGYSVDVPSTKARMLLIRGFPALKPGAVVTAFAGSKFLLPGDSLRLPLGTDHWNLHAFGTARLPTVSGGLGEAELVDYQVQMTGRARLAPVFAIARLDNDRPPRILWAGDLDSDKVPDIFYSHSRRYVLMLSSNAGDGRFVTEAASFETMDC